MIGLLVREAANVADGRRQQTHVSLLETSSSSFTSGSRLAVTKSIGAGIAEKPPSPYAYAIGRAAVEARVRTNRYRVSVARYTERASTNAPVGQASGQLLENASPPITFTRRRKDDRDIVREPPANWWRLSDSRYVFADRESRFPAAGPGGSLIHVRIAAFLDRILLIVAIYKPIQRTTRTTKSKIHTSAVTGTVFYRLPRTGRDGTPV